MGVESSSQPESVQETISFLEKFVDFNFLVLILSAFLYSDIWVLRTGKDPRTIAFKQAGDLLQGVSVFTWGLFFLIYSFLMAGVIPALRKFLAIPIIWIKPESKVYKNRSLAERRMADWSLAVLIFSVYDGLSGFFVQSSYRGFVYWTVGSLKFDGMLETVFRISVIGLIIFCVAMAFSIDE